MLCFCCCDKDSPEEPDNLGGESFEPEKKAETFLVSQHNDRLRLAQRLQKQNPGEIKPTILTDLERNADHQGHSEPVHKDNSSPAKLFRNVNWGVYYAGERETYLYQLDEEVLLLVMMIEDEYESSRTCSGITVTVEGTD